MSLTPGLRSRLRGLDRALSLPGASLPSKGWVEPFSTREWTLGELLGAFDGDFTEECRQAEVGLLRPRIMRRQRLSYPTPDAAHVFERGRTFPSSTIDAPQAKGRTIIRDLNIATGKIRDYWPPYDRADDAMLESIVAYCIQVSSSQHADIAS